MREWLDGKKTYIVAIGLAGLALYQASMGQAEAAWQSLMASFAAAGFRWFAAPQAPKED